MPAFETVKWKEKYRVLHNNYISCSLYKTLIVRYKQASRSLIAECQ